ncbi:AraC family transcriptional regulator [Sunxiuqinia sp. A32]|uniref:AraC family transcriptional regulator n=1 Tax=Sunxiuqinia sp. A32 TaxID=3461496 RepID=UPI0040465749
MSNKTEFQDVFYPAIHEADFKWGIVVTTVGLQSVEPNSQYPPKGHPQGYAFTPNKGRILDEYQLVYVSKGEGSFSTKQDKKVKLREGSLFLLHPEIWHSYKPDLLNGWDTYWVGFKGQYAKQMIEQSNFEKQNPVLNIGYKEEVVGLFRKIMDSAKREEPGSQQLMGGIICHLIGYLFQFQKNENFGDKVVISKINKARMIMREKFAIISPEEVASRLNISYSWFRRAFKEYTGFAPAQYLSQLKIQRAKDLLDHSPLSIKQIADELNFESPDYFSVYFKRNTGLAPSQYRNK